MLWDYRLARQTFKNIKRFPEKEQERIFTILEKMKVNPFSGDIKLISISMGTVPLKRSSKILTTIDFLNDFLNLSRFCSN